MTYKKPWLSVDDQLALLVRRGLHIDNRIAARACLERIGYYRLSGYLYAFRQRSGECCPVPKRANPQKTDRIVVDDFKDGSTLNGCVELYVFDKRLRSLVLDALERIEVSIRVDIAHLLGQRNTFAYLSANEFHESFARRDPGEEKSAHEKWLEKQGVLIARSREDFILHNKNKTGLPLAIWIACEVWDFGATYTLFKHMKQADQDKISARYSINNGRIFSSWLETFNYIRNVCAHHNRLWNRNITKKPKLPSSHELPWITSFLDKNGNASSRCFLELMMLAHLLKTINPNSSWSERVVGHLKSFPELNPVGLNLAGMGAPKNWEKLLTQ